MKIRKEQGGSGIGKYFWINDGDVVDVPYEMGMELLALKGTDLSFVDETEFANSEIAKINSISEPIDDLQDDRPAENVMEPLIEDAEGDPVADEDDPLQKAVQDVSPADEPVPVKESVANIIAWVGTNKIRAEAAIRAERDYRREPRPSLIQQLQQIAQS